MDFGGTPRSGQHPFLVGVGADVISFLHGFYRFFSDAGTAERKGKFKGGTNFLTVWEDRLEQVGRWENGYFHKAIVGAGVLIGRFQVDGGMTDGVLSVFVHPGVLRGDIDVPDLLSLGGVDTMVERGRPSSSTKESFTRLKGCGEGVW